MNDDVLKELEAIVERVVHPVQATMARKRQMREELLAHLLSAFEQAVEKLGDETLALQEAKNRFGDPAELSGQLQRSISGWNRLLLFAEKVVAVAVCNVLLIVVLMFLLRETPLGRTPYVGHFIAYLLLLVGLPAKLYMVVTGQNGSFSIPTIIFLLSSNGLLYGLIFERLWRMVRKKPVEIASS